MGKPVLIVVVGPTAVGKTAVSIELAKYFNSVILSADSRQFYREMSIGTAKPSMEQLQEVEHDFVDNLSIRDFYSVGDFERDALLALEKHFARHSMAFLVGGSGLYVNAVTNGLDDLPQVPEELRQQIMREVETLGLAHLVAELEKTDPDYFKVVDKENTQRVVRAIEVCRHTGRAFSSFLSKVVKERFFSIIKIGIDLKRPLLYENINKRVDQMMEAGLLEEARNLYPFRDFYALQTVGYKELFDYMDGKHSLDEAIELIKRNTRRFAKRQLTWFRKDADIVWFNNDEITRIIGYLEERIAQI